ncbi:MAG: anion permease, partial [Burkholderiaceae bacterium]|nr:anion permease [Burkholderiaceae bacterium]
MTVGATPGTGNVPAAVRAPAAKGGHAFPWKALLPIAVTAVLAIMPPPEGLAQHAWYFFAIFAGVIVALMVEPLPGAAIGLIGISLVTVLAPYVLF